MHRFVRSSIGVVAAALPVLIAIACDDRPGVACTSDRQCPAGDICRDQICGVPNPDASYYDAGDLTAETSTSCSADGVLCTLASDCCGGTCQENHCSSQPVTTPKCKNVYELCQNDCCAGLTCTNGSCR